MLSSFLQKLLFVKQFNASDGKVEILGDRYVMLPVSDLLILQEIDKTKMYNLLKKTSKKNMESIVEHAEVYKGLKNESLKNIAELSKKIGKTDEGTIKTLQTIFDIYGLGKMEILKLDNPKKTALIEVKGSTIALEQLKKGKTKNAICATPAGILAGIFSYIFNKNVDCLETNCIAKGDQECLFEIE